MEIRPLRVIFCLPGNHFSSEFLMGWSELLQALPRYNIIPLLSPAKDSNVYYVRNKCLGGSVLRGVDQKPYDGKVPYDYMMWIDSDMVFKPEQFFRLIGMGVDIASGIYMMSDGVHFATVRNMDNDYFRQHGAYDFLTLESIRGNTQPFEVDYTGFGWMCVKYGVFESLKYPWFRAIDHDLGGGIQDFSSEDVSFCILARQAGYKIYVDPTIRVGHEKPVIL